MSRKNEIKASIRKNYARVEKGASSGCCGSSCCCGGAPIDVNETSLNIGYSEDELSNAPVESNMGLGCGNPLAIASLKEGDIVLDLGSGGGFDCFLARKQVGESGYVIGVDMTPDMIELARKNAIKSGYQNVEFRLGEIERLPVEDSSIDVIISNCVINLSTDKEQVFKEAYRVLKPGGRLSASDVVAIKSLPDKLKHDLDSITSCIGGAELVENIEKMMQACGFKDINLVPKANSDDIIRSWNFGDHIEDYVASYLIEAIK